MATLAEGISPFPRDMWEGLQDAYKASPAAVDALLTRDGMQPGVALMSGLCQTADGRTALDETLQRYASPENDLPGTAGELIIGAGIHASIYAAVRVAQGYPRPLVLSDVPRFGGEFASTVRPSFYLNSRNRPGPLGQPGTPDALNVLPGAPMQPADIGASEYQTDADLGIVTRCALALNATVRVATATAVASQGDAIIVTTDRGTVIASRVIVATGVGRERTVGDVQPDGRSVYSFRQWMARVGSDPFPLADLGRVAVIGAGDGARTVVESLAGIGPAAGMAVSLDYVPRIDWYGIGEMSRSEWIACNRTRYQRIGALLPAGRDNARVIGKPRAETIRPGYGVANVNGRPYETVVVAAGYTDTIADDIGATLYPSDRGAIARQGVNEPNVYRIGPAARIPFDRDEDQRIGENAVGLFRLAPCTAALAASLSGVPA